MKLGRLMNKATVVLTAFNVSPQDTTIKLSLTDAPTNSQRLNRIICMARV